MEINLLDENFEVKDIIDIYKSFIWTERFNKCGDFELYIQASSAFTSDIKKENFLQIKESKDLMIIEKIESDRSNTEGHYFIITGESLVSILKRRIIWGFKYLNYDTSKGGKSGGLDGLIEELLNDCIIKPRDNNRKISNFIYRKTNDKRISDIELSVQYDGDNLYEIIESLCNEYKVGFKMFFEDGCIVFTLFIPTDRSDDIDAVDLVVFSPFYDNLADIKYTEDNTNYKNVSLIKFDEDSSSISNDEPIEPEDRIYLTVGNINANGLNRRELFFDADSVSITVEKDGEEVELEDDELKEHLKNKGISNLNKYTSENTVEGTIIDNLMYAYRKDYELGDIVLVDDGKGHTGRKRVNEMICSQDSGGYKMYPSFEDYKNEEED